MTESQKMHPDLTDNELETRMRRILKKILGVDEDLPTPADLRRQKGIQRASDLASKAGVTLSTVLACERGTRKFTRGDSVERIGNVIGKPIEYMAAVERQRKKAGAA